MGLCAHPDGDDVAGAVHHRQARVHQHLPQQLDVTLVFAAQRAALLALQDLDGLARAGQQHGRQRRGEDEASGVRAHRVHQSVSAGDVASDAAERLPCANTHTRERSDAETHYSVEREK